MSNNVTRNHRKILLVGTGFMAQEYIKTLKNLGYSFVVVGRGAKNVEAIKLKFSNIEVYGGGIELFLKNSVERFYASIVAVNVQNLVEVSSKLIDFGIKKILLEKPGALYVEELIELNKIAQTHETLINIAYNRRYYSSVEKLLQLAEADGGILSLHFEFTEWIHTIDPSEYDSYTLNKWIVSNSSHVIDLAFFIIGLPKSINCNVIGENLIEWHQSGSIFTGSGVSLKNIPFTYHSNWLSAGRWSVEVLTSENRFILRPLEKLQVQKRRSIMIEDVELNHEEGAIEIKEGLAQMLAEFIHSESTSLPNLQDQIDLISHINLIGAYKKH